MPEWLWLIALGLLGVVGSGLVAAGVFSLIVKVGVISRMVARTKTAVDLGWYEDVIVLGATGGCLYSIFDLPLPGGAWFMLPMGLFFGCFIGCLALALAEVVSAFPIFARRAKLKKGLSILVVAMSLGKYAFSWLTLVMGK